jgi:hypothetical protein
LITGIWPARPFDRAVAILFALVLLALGIATFVNAPLSFDAAYFLFRVLDTHRFADAHNRLINILLRVPVLVATRFTQDIRVLCLTFSAAYASIPVLGLAASWHVCRSRRPSLFIWPAISICIAALPGEFSFQSEQIMVAALLWPALLTGLIGAQAAVLALVAIISVIAAASHPIASTLLGIAVLAAVVSAITRPQVRRASLGFAFFLGLLLLARVAVPLNEYERHAFDVRIVIDSFRNSVLGWPLVAIALTMVAALSCLIPARRRACVYLMAPLILSGGALVVWAIKPANWAICLDYRYWVPPISLMFMSGAAVEELWLRRSTESRLQEIRLYAIPLVGAIFLVVLSIQSVQWGMMSKRLSKDLMDSDRGCINRNSLSWLPYTALGHWAVPFYAVELQGRKPSTLLLPAQFACRIFASNGDAIFVYQGAFKYIRPHGEGWFDFEDAHLKAESLFRDYLSGINRSRPPTPPRE